MQLTQGYLPHRVVAAIRSFLKFFIAASTSFNMLSSLF